MKLVPLLYQALGLLLLASCGASTRAFQATDKSGALDGQGRELGKWTYYFLDEAGNRTSKKAEGSYRSGRQNGPWTYWYNSQQERWVGSLEDGRLHGAGTYYYPNGAPQARGSFMEGEKEGVWTFGSLDNEPVVQGDYVGGRRGLRWTHWYPGQEVKANGYRLNDEKVGVWSYWDRSGNRYEASYPVPDGYEIYAEENEGTLVREGFLHRGRPSGRWATYHPNGRRRLMGDFVNGKANGHWIGFDEQGAVVAAGTLNDGNPVGSWLVRVGSRLDLLPAPEARERIGDWIADMQRPTASGSVQTAGVSTSPPPPDELAREVEKRPLVPVCPQPWKVEELEKVPTIAALYSSGVVPQGRSRYSRKVRIKRDDLKSDGLVGNPLPRIPLFVGDEEKFDVETLRGERTVMVVLRGYTGTDQICIYCEEQTQAIAAYEKQFEEQDTNVMFVWPGERGDLNAFQEALRDAASAEGVDLDKLTMAYDPGFEFVDALNIREDLAKPTTLILDPSGVVQYAYVGVDKVSRPSAQALLDALRSLGQP